jgi:hypothetical protein
MHRHRIAIADKTFRHLELRIMLKANSGTSSGGNDEERMISWTIPGYTADVMLTGVTNQQQLDEEIVVWRNHGGSRVIAASAERFGSNDQG